MVGLGLRFKNSGLDLLRKYHSSLISVKCQALCFGLLPCMRCNCVSMTTWKHHLGFIYLL